MSPEEVARGDYSGTIPGKRSRTRLTYRVLTAHRVREQLDGAPPELRGYVDGVVAFLREDPAAERGPVMG
jgi:hypothetical protein